MDVSYQRSPNRSYMILSGKESGEGYEEEMLRQNEVAMLLSFYMVDLDHGLQVWYDITRLRSVRDIVRQEGVTLENLHMFFNGIAMAFSMLSQYLISQKNIVIGPDTVYFNRDEPPMVKLCYCPLEHDDYEMQLQNLMTFFMEEVDHKKEQVTKMVYKLYEMCQDPVSLEELVDMLRSELPQDRIEEPVLKPIETEEFTPSEDRVITEHTDKMADSVSDNSGTYNAQSMEPDPEIIPKKKVKRWDKPSLKQRIVNYFLEKWPVLSKAKKKKAEESNEQEEAHDFSQDFVFDPDTDLLTKTAFMKPDEDSADGRKDRGEAVFQGILIYDGKGAEKDHYIKKDNFRIGSQNGDNEAVLHSRVVSRHHALITRSGNDFFIEDLNSTNGTYVNGTLLPYHDKVKLNRMDQIVFADVAYHII
ncbi:MAG: FHA domain-containing protein [Lachnospiraceae bacterium]|uniref:FHA domain-containing protein n=1 Tax=Candidatus Weimeria bifida TaxID=2599074 RepID=A0A6N7J0M7_9FIRM|nr:FHA domain-containing protein [Candidatus Weimeria bifida]RRF96840.1 MAG: FHA domain-containing protein [Lachnospiraceae bacterium]